MKVKVEKDSMKDKLTFLYKFLLILTVVGLILTGVISTLFDNSDLALVFFIITLVIYTIFLILQAKGGDYIELRKKTESLKLRGKKFKYDDILNKLKNNTSYNNEYYEFCDNIPGQLFYKYSTEI